MSGYPLAYAMLLVTSARLGGVIATTAFGGACLALAHEPGHAVRGFALINVALAVVGLGRRRDRSVTFCEGDVRFLPRGDDRS